MGSRFLRARAGPSGDEGRRKCTQLALRGGQGTGHANHGHQAQATCPRSPCRSVRRAAGTRKQAAWVSGQMVFPVPGELCVSFRSLHLSQHGAGLWTQKI